MIGFRAAKVIRGLMKEKKCEPDRSHPARGCVKSVGAKFGNDRIFVQGNFAEMSRRIQCSENEFSHSLALPPSEAMAI